MVVRRTRDGISKKKLINSSELVPGDLVEITNYSRVPADLLLINGSCIIKDDFTNENNKPKIRVSFGTFGIAKPRDKKCNLYAGNQVLYTIN